jgi:hypothetical protein
MIAVLRAASGINQECGKGALRRISGLFFLLAGAVLWAGCSQRAAEMEDQGAARSFFSGEAAADAGPPAANSAALAGAERSRKLVRRASLRIRVADPARAEAPLTAAMESCHAYAASVEIYEDSRSYTIRVPQAAYGKLFSVLSEMGSLLYRSESAEDVTLNYYDLEGRLATKRELLKTFQNYLGRATDIEEIMTVETRIAELQQEIDWLGKELRSLADLVDYATIDLTLVGPASFHRPSAADRITDLFRSFGDFASFLLVILTGAVIYGIPCIFILIVLFWLLFGRIGLIKKLWRLAAGNTFSKNKEVKHE